MTHAATPTLSHDVAAIAAEALATADRHAARLGPVSALRALIFAALARILASLAGIIALWEAGLLPAAAPRAAGSRTPRTQPAVPAPHASAPSGLSSPAHARAMPRAPSISHARAEPARAPIAPPARIIPVRISLAAPGRAASNGAPSRSDVLVLPPAVFSKPLWAPKPHCDSIVP